MPLASSPWYTVPLTPSVWDRKRNGSAAGVFRSTVLPGWNIIVPVLEHCLSLNSWRRQKFSFVGAIAQGSGDGSPPSGVQGRSPGRGWGMKSPEGETVCRHCLQILTAETIKISHYLPPDSWPVSFMVGAKRPIWSLSPLALPGSATVA